MQDTLHSREVTAPKRASQYTLNQLVACDERTTHSISCSVQGAADSEARTCSAGARVAPALADIGCRQGTAVMSSGFRVQRTCSAGARVAEPSRCVMGCRRGTAVSGWFCRRARRCSRSLRRLQRHVLPQYSAAMLSTPIDIYAHSMSFRQSCLTPCLSASAVHSMHSIAHRSTIQGFSSTTNLARGVNHFVVAGNHASSHLSAASWISVCVGSVGMTRFMRRAGRPSLPGRASTDTKVR